MKDKVEITIGLGNYHPSVKGGREYISIDYDGKRYGGSSPNDSEEEMQSSIAHAKKVIKKHGDIPFVVDKRHSAGLNQWIN